MRWYETDMGQFAVLILAITGGFGLLALLTGVGCWLSQACGG